MADLSVVIPTLDRVETIEKVLAQLSRQRLDGARIEVIVVADPAESEPDVLGQLVNSLSHPAALLTRHAPGVSAARNMGWRSASSELVLFLGDDIVPTPDLVREHLAWHRANPDPRIGVLGDVRWSRELRVTPFMRWLEHGIQFDYRSIQGTEAGWGRLYTSNVSLKRTMLDRVGGFDEEHFPFGYEDLDLGLRMDELGFRLLYNRRAAAEHLHPVTLDSWRRRLDQVASSELEFVRLHPQVSPYFFQLFATAARAGRARGRGRHLMKFVPRGTPCLGPRVWKSADLYYRQALAPSFLSAWERARSLDSARESVPVDEP